MPEFAGVSYAVREDVSGDPRTDVPTRLLLERYHSRGARLLIVEAGCGALAARYARDFSRMLCVNSLAQNHAASQETAALAGAKNILCRLSDIPRASGEPDAPYDEIIYRLSRGTSQASAVLVESFRLLREGGALVVCGHKEEGIKSIEKRGEALFGRVEILEIKSSCRILRFRQSAASPGFSVTETDYFEDRRLTARLQDGSPLPYWTKPGIFSYRETDPGTALLLRHFPCCAGKEVLDLACGSGILALAASRSGARSVCGLDNSIIAIRCAERNFQENTVSGELRCAHFAEPLDRAFDLIVSNPPFHIGGKADPRLCLAILESCHQKLREGGELFLVANQFLSYYQHGQKRFSTVEAMALENGYAIYRMVK